MSGRWGVFLDRDGAINEEVGLVTDPAQLVLIPGAAEGLKLLAAAGAVLVVVTNQSAVARGLVSEEGIVRINEHLKALLKGKGASFDDALFCPHHPEKGHPEANDPRYRRDCECRKPKPGMILAGARRNGIDLAASFMVGDSTRDIEAGRRAGCRASVLVCTGHGGRDAHCPEAVPEAVVDDLRAAADWILAKRKAR